MCGISLVLYHSFTCGCLVLPMAFLEAHFTNKGTGAQRLRNMSKLMYVLSEKPEVGPGM